MIRVRVRVKVGVRVTVFAQRDGKRELLRRRLIGGEDRAEVAEHPVDRVARLAGVGVRVWG